MEGAGGEGATINIIKRGPLRERGRPSKEVTSRHARTHAQKLKEAAAPTKGKKDVKVKAKAKSKAELAKDKKTQYDKFGGNFEDQEYDGYADKYEDDFF